MNYRLLTSEHNDNAHINLITEETSTNLRLEQFW